MPAGNSGPPQMVLQGITANPDLTGLASPGANDPPPPPLGVTDHQTNPQYPLDNIVSIFPGAVLREPLPSPYLSSMMIQFPLI